MDFNRLIDNNTQEDFIAEQRRMESRQLRFALASLYFETFGNETKPDNLIKDCNQLEEWIIGNA